MIKVEKKHIADDSPLDGYKRHIARANHIIFKEVLNNINSNNERQ